VLKETTRRAGLLLNTPVKKGSKRKPFIGNAVPDGSESSPPGAATSYLTTKNKDHLYTH
jgi:hypothetical protein